MNANDYADRGKYPELGVPVPFEGDTTRPLLVAAALGAPPESRDPVDLALVRAASEKEDLGGYQLLGFTLLDRRARHSVARVRRTGADVEKLVARGDLEAIMALLPAGVRAKCRGALQGGPKLADGYRALAVATWLITAESTGGWRFLGYIPVRVSRPAAPCPSLWDRLFKRCKIK